MSINRRFVVLGGAGTIGKFVVRDLFESHPKNQVLIADYNIEAAERLAKSFHSKRISACFADADKEAELTQLLENSSVVINCLQHNFNLQIMEAASYVGANYVDLGGLFTWTKRQLELHALFQKFGLTAVIGMGCAPGITNVLAAYAASKLRTITSIKIRVGSVNFNPQNKNELRFPYSAQTILEELTLEPYIFRNGQFKTVPPQTGWERTEFPKPVSKAWTLLTRHSEVATLPISFRNKGLRHCDFKVGFDKKFVKEIERLKERGWKLDQFKTLILPEKYPNDYEISQVIADNMILDCHARSKSAWNAGAGDIDTACPISIVAQMIATGQINQRGVFPPETIVPIYPFFSELNKRELEIKISAK